MYFEKLMERVKRDQKELAKSYDTDESKIVYIGDNKYIVVMRDGMEIRI